MRPTDNSQFTEEQRTEAYRMEHMSQVRQQTKALQSIQSYVGWLLGIVAFGILAFVIVSITVSHL